MFVQAGQCDLLGMNKAILCLFLGSVLVGDLSRNVPDTARARVAAMEYFRLMSLKSEESGSALELDAPKLQLPLEGTIELKDVVFEYPTRPDVPVLRRLCMKVEAGKKLALVSPSGAGKSTILSVIERFYSFRDGSVTVDGHDIRAIDVQVLRSQMGFVHQQPDLFNRSIRDNIAYGLAHAPGTPVSHDAIEEAAKTAHAHGFITKLPEGYDTCVGPRGERLSGGQRQRIALARSVVRKPPILLLDEATSALDSETESIVQKALDTATKGRTTIVVAHRLSTVRDADSIAVLFDGVIAEQGCHEELMQAKGRYYDLQMAQSR